MSAPLHNVVTLAGMVSVTVYLFLRPESHTLCDVAWAYAILAGGQAAGNWSLGARAGNKGAV